MLVSWQAPCLKHCAASVQPGCALQKKTCLRLEPERCIQQAAAIETPSASYDCDLLRCCVAFCYAALAAAATSYTSAASLAKTLPDALLELPEACSRHGHWPTPRYLACARMRMSCMAVASRSRRGSKSRSFSLHQHGRSWPPWHRPTSASYLSTKC